MVLNATTAIQGVKPTIGVVQKTWFTQEIRPCV